MIFNQKIYSMSFMPNPRQINLPMLVCSGVEPLALDRLIRNVDVLAVVADADESFRELDRFESCDVLRVTSHEECRRLGSRMRNGMPQW